MAKVKKMSLRFPVQLTVEELADAILWGEPVSGLSGNGYAHDFKEFIIDLIKELDEGVAETDFTLKLYKHFKQVTKQIRNGEI